MLLGRREETTMATGNYVLLAVMAEGRFLPKFEVAKFMSSAGIMGRSRLSLKELRFLL